MYWCAMVPHRTEFRCTFDFNWKSSGITEREVISKKKEAIYKLMVMAHGADGVLLRAGRIGSEGCCL